MLNTFNIYFCTYALNILQGLKISLAYKHQFCVNALLSKIYLYTNFTIIHQM